MLEPGIDIEKRNNSDEMLNNITEEGEAPAYRMRSQSSSLLVRAFSSASLLLLSGGAAPVTEASELDATPIKVKREASLDSLTGIPT